MRTPARQRFDPFLDEHHLPPGAAFDRALSEKIGTWADLAVLLVSREFLDPDRYTQHELDAMRRRWPGGEGRILPFLLPDSTALRRALPAALAGLSAKAVDADVEGDVVRTLLAWEQAERRRRESETQERAEQRRRAQEQRRRFARLAARSGAVVAAVFGVLVALYSVDWHQRTRIDRFVGLSGYRSVDAERADIGAIGIKEKLRRRRGIEASGFSRRMAKPLENVPITTHERGLLTPEWLQSAGDIAGLNGERLAVLAKGEWQVVAQEITDSQAAILQLRALFDRGELSMPNGDPGHVVTGIVAAKRNERHEVIFYQLSVICREASGRPVTLKADPIGGGGC